MLYHVMSRGNDRREVFIDPEDFARYLFLLERSAARLRIEVIGYCLMPNHMHLLLKPSEHEISRLMQQVNSAYCGWFNRRHGRVGHVLQGRYKAQIVEGGPSFLRVLRYVMLNPVAAQLVQRPSQWRWSSFRQTTGMDAAPTFLTLADVWRVFDPVDRTEAQRCFRTFVDQPGNGNELPPGLVTGSDGFIRGFAALLAAHRNDRDLVYAERFAARPRLAELLPDVKRGPAVREGARCAFHLHAFTLREIAEHVGISPATAWVWTRQSLQAA